MKQEKWKKGNLNVEAVNFFLVTDKTIHLKSSQVYNLVYTNHLTIFMIVLELALLHSIFYEL